MRRIGAHAVLETIWCVFAHLPQWGPFFISVCLFSSPLPSLFSLDPIFGGSSCICPSGGHFFFISVCPFSSPLPSLFSFDPICFDQIFTSFDLGRILCGGLVLTPSLRPFGVSSCICPSGGHHPFEKKNGHFCVDWIRHKISIRYFRLLPGFRKYCVLCDGSPAERDPKKLLLKKKNCF